MAVPQADAFPFELGIQPEDIVCAWFGPNLTTLKNLVGGYIEAVTRNGAVACMHEEGKLVGLQANPRATAFMLDQRMIFAFDLVVGDVIILGTNAEGEEADVPAEMATALGPVHEPAAGVR
ncbi:DUF3846 domain-containing protein [Arthrobacter rhombi]|uniref:DUF3846 domain-containing protein n=1 Tax=Arthrobacter rhombi TaxID=71253 RepID=UPI003FD21A1E